MASSRRETDEEKLKRQIDALQKQVNSLNRSVVTQPVNEKSGQSTKKYFGWMTEEQWRRRKPIIIGSLWILLYCVSIGTFLTGIIGFMDSDFYGSDNSTSIAITLTIVGVALIVFSIVFTIYRRRVRRRNRALARREIVAKAYGVSANDVTDEMVEAYSHKLDKQIKDAKSTAEIEHQEAVERMKEDLDKYK